jgi:hypothetical protein
MNSIHIDIEENMMKLPNMYWLPKMHKIPYPKERYVAASNCCTTKKLSSILTNCFKLSLLQHRKYCNTIYNNTGVNMMWIIDNSNSVLDIIKEYNHNKKIDTVNTYDFSTLYTNIPHDDLKLQMKWIIEKTFYNSKHSKMYVSDDVATWYKRKNTRIIDKNMLLSYMNFLIDNIYVCVGNNIFRQNIGIPMGTDCAPFLANLYLYALEHNYLQTLMKKDIHAARKFSNSFRYIDDLLAFNNILFDSHKKDMYPFVLNKENDNVKHCHFLDLNISVVENMIHSSIYDKRDDFNFDINVFPILSGNIHMVRSHGVIISQLIRYSKACSSLDDFISKTKNTILKLPRQFFNIGLLKKKCNNFYDKYYDLIEKFKISRSKFIYEIFNR